jgi:serine incorporator 1/3
VTSATWCCCTASASLLGSCCGNDKGSNIPPSATSGRRRSVFLLLLTIAFAFAFQYGVGPYIQSIHIDNYVTRAWTDGCLDLVTEPLRQHCVGNNGVYRATASALVFYILAAIAVAFKPTANREAWPAKFILFLFIVLGTCFIPNDPLFSGVYLQVARVGGVLFMLAQQVIILDLAFNWNDSWVEKSNAAESEEAGSGKKWLTAILASCVLLFTVSLAGIVLMFVYFSGCGTNEAFISITLGMSIIVTVAQLSGHEGSLLSSGVIVGYSVFLCYTAGTFSS